MLYTPYLHANTYECYGDQLSHEKIISSARLVLIHANLKEGYGVFEIYNPHSFDIVIPAKSLDGKTLWYDPLFVSLMAIDLNNILNGWLMILRNYVDGYQKEIDENGEDVDLIIEPGDKKEFNAKLYTYEEFNWADMNQYAFRLRLDRAGKVNSDFAHFILSQQMGIIFSDPFCFRNN